MLLLPAPVFLLLLLLFCMSRQHKIRTLIQNISFMAGIAKDLNTCSTDTNYLQVQ